MFPGTKQAKVYSNWLENWGVITIQRCSKVSINFWRGSVHIQSRP